MNYKITIERKEPNPNFEEEYKAWDNSRMSRYSDDKIRPQEHFITNALICELTEQQFKAIKAEVFKVFE